MTCTLNGASGEEVAKACNDITCSIIFRLLGLGISVCKTEGGVVVK